MSDDWTKDPAWKEYERHVLMDMVPKLSESALTISLVPTDEGDVKFWVELGASIMLDKPIIVVVANDRRLPERLRRVADEIVVGDLMTDEGRKELSERLALLSHRLNEEAE